MSIYSNGSLLVLFGVYITEKTVRLLEKNQITFKISLFAKKFDVKNVVEKIFGLRVISVSTIRVKGKQSRKVKSRGISYTGDWKKAVVSVESIF